MVDWSSCGWFNWLIGLVGFDVWMVVYLFGWLVACLFWLIGWLVGLVVFVGWMVCLFVWWVDLFIF